MSQRMCYIDVGKVTLSLIYGSAETKFYSTVLHSTHSKWPVRLLALRRKKILLRSFSSYFLEIYITLYIYILHIIYCMMGFDTISLFFFLSRRTWKCSTQPTSCFPVQKYLTTWSCTFGSSIVLWTFFRAYYCADIPISLLLAHRPIVFLLYLDLSIFVHNCMNISCINLNT